MLEKEYSEIDKIIEQLQQGKITENKALSILTALYNYKSDSDDKKQYKIANLIADKSLISEEFLSDMRPKTPEEIIIENERKDEIKEFLNLAMSELSKKSKRYPLLIYLYVIKGFSINQCASVLGVKRQTIENYFKKIKIFFEKWAAKYPKFLYIYRGVFDSLKDTPIKHSVSSVQPPSFPFERAMRVEKGKWYTTKTYGTRKKVYGVKASCALSKYFEDSFGDIDIKCPKLCGRKNCTKI